MNSSRTRTKEARLEARIDPEQKELIQRAADIEGVSLTDFMLSALHRAAEETIMRHNVVTLTAAGTATFVDSLLNSTGPNEELKQAYEEYLRFDGE